MSAGTQPSCRLSESTPGPRGQESKTMNSIFEIPKEDNIEIINEVKESVEEFEFKKFPGGYTIKRHKGKKSKVYDKAVEETANMFKNANKRSELNMNDKFKLRVIHLPPGQQANNVNATIEVTVNGNLSNVNVIFYKSTNSIKITKMKGSDVEAVDFVANSMLKPHLLSLIRGDTSHIITQRKHEETLTIKENRIIDDDKKVCCGQCGKDFKTRIEVESHREITHMGTKAKAQSKCTECDKTMGSKQNLDIHMSCMHKKGVKRNAEPTSPKVPVWKGEYKCTMCKLSMGSKADLDNHMSCMHKVKEYKCLNCDGQFEDENGLTGHKLKCLDQHGSVQPIKNNDLVTDVEESNEEENIYECKVCGLILHNQSNGLALGKLFNHTRVDHNMDIDHQEPHICNLCGLKTFSDNDLRLHKRNDHLTKSDSMSPPHKRIKDDGKIDPPSVMNVTDNANETLSFEEKRFIDRFEEKAEEDKDIEKMMDVENEEEKVRTIQKKQ